MVKRKEGAKLLQALLVFFAFFACCVTAQKPESEFVVKIREASPKMAVKPVLFLLHGYGSNEEDLFDLSATMDGRYTVYSLRAPLALENGGFGWYRLHWTDDKKIVYDYKEAKKSREKVMAFILEVCRSRKLDSSAVYLLGFSQGAMLAYDIALSSPGKIKGVLALSGRLIEESKQQCSNWKKFQTTSFFIAHGNFDNVIPFQEAELARDFLKTKGVAELEFRSYSMQHVLNGQELNDIRVWLKKLLDKQYSDTAEKKQIKPVSK